VPSVDLGAHTPMHGKIAENFADTFIPGITELLRKGADAHRTGMTSASYGGDDSERLDTLTSLAIRRSSSFHKWKRILRDVGRDYETFVDEVLRHAPLVAKGLDSNKSFDTVRA
jgi:hypothetical protein